MTGAQKTAEAFSRANIIEGDSKKKRGAGMSSPPMKIHGEEEEIGRRKNLSVNPTY